MDKNNIRLSSSEISCLWSTYVQETLTICFLRYFIHHTEDIKIKPLLNKSMKESMNRLEFLNDLFEKENFPVPDGFSEEEIDLTKPPLFEEIFSLTFIYAMSSLSLVNFSFKLSNVARNDVKSFVKKCLEESSNLYSTATDFMLEKGIYDRPPSIPYPKNVTYIEGKTYLSGFIGEKRPLNVIELGELFHNIERSNFALLICIGFLQVVTDEEIRNLLKQGKEMSQERINYLNELLKEEEYMGTVLTRMEVTDSTISPFSDKLIVGLFSLLNSIDITLVGHSLSLSMRTDLITYFSKYITKILAFSKNGFDIMVNRNWLESPPQSFNRKKIIEK